nr:uncharacterized protein LOC113825002 [Penaeus vannamei]
MPAFPPVGRRLARWLILAAMVSAATPEILYAETANITFGEWLFQQKPNQILEEVTIRGRLCFCRRAVVPPSGPDTSSFEVVSVEASSESTSPSLPLTTFSFLKETED